MYFPGAAVDMMRSSYTMIYVYVIDEETSTDAMFPNLENVPRVQSHCYWTADGSRLVTWTNLCKMQEPVTCLSHHIRKLFLSQAQLSGMQTVVITFT